MCVFRSSVFRFHLVESLSYFVEALKHSKGDRHSVVYVFVLKIGMCMCDYKMHPFVSLCVCVCMCVNFFHASECIRRNVRMCLFERGNFNVLLFHMMIWWWWW